MRAPERLVRSLTTKLVLSFLAVLTLEAALGMLLVRRAVQQEFERFVREEAVQDFISRCLAHYELVGSWAGIRETMRPGFHRGEPRRPRDRGGAKGPKERRRDKGGRGRARQPPPPFALADADGIVVLGAGEFTHGVRAREEALDDSIPIELDGERVGLVLRTEASRNPGPSERRYASRADQGLLSASLIAVGIAGLFAFFAARLYTKPLRQLTAAVDSMKRGELRQKVEVSSNDELGELTQAFNQMSEDLDRAHSARQRMTADIAHDLRTPLTVIAGYLEAMCDGTLEPTTERLETLRSETDRLQRMVADLRTLSLADTGELVLRLEPRSPESFLEQIAESFALRAGAGRGGDRDAVR